jgi:hypothetical protein
MDTRRTFIKRSAGTALVFGAGIRSVLADEGGGGSGGCLTTTGGSFLIAQRTFYTRCTLSCPPSGGSCDSLGYSSCVDHNGNPYGAYQAGGGTNEVGYC